MKYKNACIGCMQHSCNNNASNMALPPLCVRNMLGGLGPRPACAVAPAERPAGGLRVSLAILVALWRRIARHATPHRLVIIVRVQRSSGPARHRAGSCSRCPLLSFLVAVASRGCLLGFLLFCLLLRCTNTSRAHTTSCGSYLR